MSTSGGFGKRCGYPFGGGIICMNRTGGERCFRHREPSEESVARGGRCSAERCQLRTIAGWSFCFRHVEAENERRRA